VAFMMIGLMGMSYYSAPSTQPTINVEYQGLHRDESIMEGEDEEVEIVEHEHPSTTSAVAQEEDTATGTHYRALHATASQDEQDGTVDQNETIEAGATDNDNAVDEEAMVIQASGESSGTATRLERDEGFNPETHQIFLGIKWKRRTLGILAAMIGTGIYGGSIMAPMKWAPDDAKGLGYLISFGIGASIVTMSLWIVRFAYSAHRHKSFVKGYQILPSFHLRKMWLHGGTAGLLWSIGNFFSIISVDYLGEGVGYSVVQSSMLVAGLWGIFYFKEVKGVETIAKWFASAVLTVCGIILLSYEHHEK
jgi:hypothetical protein